ncbi:MAG: hypothetical protein ABSE99_06735 [Terracidiphilus sp.]|jgi:hypothetical protein
MHLSPLAALIGWIPVGLCLFRRYPVRIAILANFLGGWAVLPGARYIPTTEAFPYWILGVCLPANYFFTKAMVTGLTGLAGILIFHPADLKRFRPGLCDLPMAVWCCVPLLSAFTHWSTHREGLVGAAYQAISWGAPWLLGRIYFSDRASLLLAAKACVVAGICYVPVCLFELCAGPQLYAFIYGYQPYRWVGAERYIGFRPIGLLEDGNQLGIWMAVATLLAVCLSARRLVARILGLPMGWVATGLAATTLLCQSVGSILLLLLLLPLALLKRRSVLRALVAVLVLGIVSFALFRMAAPVSLRLLALRSGAAHSISSALTEIGRHSLAWRVVREESDMATALQKPLLGFGQWNWWQNGKFRPWSLWLLVLGMYGLVGLVAFGLILFLPVIRASRPSAGGSDPDDATLRLALVAVILMVAFDNLLNGAMILPYLLVMGGLTTRRASLGASTRESRMSSGRANSLDSDVLAS